MSSQIMADQSRRAMRAGFTIVELLVVVTIIGILMALLFPAINVVRGNARKAACTNNQRQVGQGVLAYTASKGFFPSNGGPAPGTPGTNWTWVPRIMAQVGRNDLYQDLINAPGNVASTNVVVEILQCPADPAAVATDPQLSYAGNGGQEDQAMSPFDELPNGIFFRERKQSLAYVTNNDGVSTTLMLTENVDLGNWNVAAASGDTNVVVWGVTNQKAINKEIGEGTGIEYARPSSRHSGGFNATFCDGSTKFLSQELSTDIYSYIMTPAGSTKLSHPLLSAEMLDQ